MEELAERNRAHGAEIAPETNHVAWGGEPLDLVTVVEGILRAERSSRR